MTANRWQDTFDSRGTCLLFIYGKWSGRYTCKASFSWETVQLAEKITLNLVIINRNAEGARNPSRSLFDKNPTDTQNQPYRPTIISVFLQYESSKRLPTSLIDEKIIQVLLRLNGIMFASQYEAVAHYAMPAEFTIWCLLASLHCLPPLYY